MLLDVKRLVAALAACVCLLVASVPDADAVLVARWDIDDGSGGNVLAQVGAINGQFWEGGLVNWEAGGPPKTTLPDETEITTSNHLNFDLNAEEFSYDYVEMLDPAGTLSPPAITVAFWTKTLDPGFLNIGKVILSKWSDTGGFTWEFGIGLSAPHNLFWRVQPDGGAQQFVGASGTGFTAEDFNNGEWHHFVGTYDGSVAEEATLIVDGRSLGSKTVTESLASGTSPMLIGQRPYSSPYQSPFKGRIGGPLLIFDHALTGEEAAALGGFEYVPPPPPPPPEPIGQWNLNEVVGGITTPKVIGPQDGQINGNVTLTSGGPPATTLPDGTVVSPTNHFSNAGGTDADYIDFGTDTSMSPQMLTVAFWAKAQEGWYDPAGVIMVSKWSKDAGMSWEVGWGHSSGRVGPLFLRLMVDGSNYFVQGTDPDWFDVEEFDDGQWHHIAATFDGSFGSTYVDGELVVSDPITGILNSSEAPLRLFQRDYPVYEAVYRGLIGGPLLICNYALTAEEVAALIAGEAPIPGDANSDGQVTDADAAILATNWQQTGVGWAQGDFNGDGQVTDADAAILATHWQEGVTEGGATVPEPGPIVLLAGALLSLLVRRRCKRIT